MKVYVAKKLNRHGQVIFAKLGHAKAWIVAEFLAEKPVGRDLTSWVWWKEGSRWHFSPPNSKAAVSKNLIPEATIEWHTVIESL